MGYESVNAVVAHTRYINLIVNCTLNILVVSVLNLILRLNQARFPFSPARFIQNIHKIFILLYVYFISVCILQ